MCAAGKVLREFSPWVSEQMVIFEVHLRLDPFGVCSGYGFQ